MSRKYSILGLGQVLIAVLISAFLSGAQVRAQDEKDPHRPDCADAQCRKIQSFLKLHYCGATPFGNGPDNGCEPKAPKYPRAGVEVRADFHCEWKESKNVEQCEQHGQPSSAVHDILMQELRKLGLPPQAKGDTYFKVWDSKQSGWSIAGAYYSRLDGVNLEICQVLVTIDQKSRILVLRKLPFKKANADVPDVTEWFPIDLADAEGDGHVDVILEADAYEDHWLEAVRVRPGSAKTVFSGLGYYL
jgi:hypothetical protein